MRAGPGLPVWALGLSLLAACGQQPAPPAAAGDDMAPARRIIALAPHLVELVYAAGAGDRLVAVVEFSDHPAAARALPRIGDAFRVDFEAVVAAGPDLVLGWPSGNSSEVLQRLQRLGLRVVALEPRSLDDIGAQIRLIGDLAGSPAAAAAAADRFDSELQDLRDRQQAARPVRVFYQISAQPLITVGAAHFISQALAVCAGQNIFAELGTPAAVVSREAVIAGNPEAIIASEPNMPVADPSRGPAELAAWRDWPAIPAVAGGHLFLIDPGLVSVPGPRLTTGIRRICGYLASVRGEPLPDQSGPGSGLPEDLPAAASPAGQAGDDEQKIGQAIQVAQ